VPPELRAAGAAGVGEHVRFYGLDELFPGSGLEARASTRPLLGLT
jgi:hypothetical protein